MTIEEAASTAKAIYLQAAALAGREVAPESPKRWPVLCETVVGDPRVGSSSRNILSENKFLL